MRAPIPSARSIRSAHRSKHSALPTRFSPIPKAISSRVTADFRPARAMGLAELPVITLSGLSETQKRALRIADNKIALNAGWDLEILQLELGELGSIDVDIDRVSIGEHD